MIEIHGKGLGDGYKDSGMDVSPSEGSLEMGPKWNCPRGGNPLFGLCRHGAPASPARWVRQEHKETEHVPQSEQPQ